MPNLVRYGSWLIETQTPVVIAGAIALVVPARALWPGARRSEPLVMAALSATVWVSYCLYREFDAWWFLRFLLPSWPFLMAGTAAVLHALTSRRGPIVRAATTTPWDRPALVRAAPEARSNQVPDPSPSAAEHADSRPSAVVAAAVARPGDTEGRCSRQGCGEQLGVGGQQTPYVAVRMALHDMLSIPFSVPLGAVLAVRIAWPELVGTSRAGSRLVDPLAWTLVLIIAASGLYYAFFSAFFVVALSAWSSVHRRTVGPMARAGFACGALVLALLVTGPGLGLIDVLDGRVPLTRRFAVEQQSYGLAPADALTTFRSWPSPPPGVLSSPGALGREGQWGEWPGILLTLVILLAPVLGLWAMRAWRLRRNDSRLVAVILCAVAIASGVLFSTSGGIGLWFNELVTPAIRAQNRVTPFLTFFALVLMLTIVDRARRGSNPIGRATWTVGLASGLFLSAWPSLGVLPAKQQAFLNDALQQADRKSLLRLVDRIGGAGVKTVLQVPVAGWPEAAPLRGVEPTRFELPYILSPPGSDVRWSYGLSARQVEFTQLFALVDGQRERGLAAAAADLGFDAVLVDKAALSPTEGPELVSAIERDVSPDCRLFDDDYRVLFQVAATGGHTSCAVRRDATRRYVTAEGRYGVSLLRTGWASPELDHTWTDGPRARILVPVGRWADRRRPVEVTLTFGVYRPDPRRAKEFVFRVGDLEVGRLTVRPGEPAPATTTLSLPVNRVINEHTAVDILVADPEQPSNYGQADSRRLGLALQEFEVR